MSEPKDSYYIVESAAYIRPQQYIMSTVRGSFRITTNIEQAFHFPTLSDAKAAADMPGFWSIERIWVPTLVLEIEPLAPGLPEAVDQVLPVVKEFLSPENGQSLLEADEATIDPAGEFSRQTKEGFAGQKESGEAQGLAASNTTANLL